jgi:hypothetical protein
VNVLKEQFTMQNEDGKQIVTKEEYLGNS